MFYFTYDNSDNSSVFAKVLFILFFNALYTRIYYHERFEGNKIKVAVYFWNFQNCILRSPEKPLTNKLTREHLSILDNWFLRGNCQPERVFIAVFLCVCWGT